MSNIYYITGPALGTTYNINLTNASSFIKLPVTTTTTDVIMKDNLKKLENGAKNNDLKTLIKIYQYDKTLAVPTSFTTSMTSISNLRAMYYTNAYSQKPLGVSAALDSTVNKDGIPISLDPKITTHAHIINVITKYKVDNDNYYQFTINTQSLNITDDSNYKASKIFTTLDINTTTNVINETITTARKPGPFDGRFATGADYYAYYGDVGKNSKVVYLKAGEYILNFMIYSLVPASFYFAANVYKDAAKTNFITYLNTISGGKSVGYFPITDAINTYITSTQASCVNDSLIQTTGLCNDSLIKEDILNNNVMAYCFDSNEPIYEKDTLGNYKIKNNCNTIYNKNSLNSIIKTNLKNKYINSLQTHINNLNNNTITSDDDLKATEIYKQFLPNETDINIPISLLKICEEKANTKFNLNESTSKLCNVISNATHYNTTTQANINTSKNNVKQNYCNQKDSNGKYFYESDALCTPLYNNLLSTIISNRCTPNGIYNSNDDYCNTMSNNNITSTNEPYNTINIKRTEALKNAIRLGTTDLNSNTSNKNILDDLNLYNYAINKYNDYPNKKIDDELLINSLFDFCENRDPNYLENKTGQCYGIYNKYKTNTKIIDSRNRMRTELCKNYDNITSNKIDDETSNIYGCKDLIFNSTANPINKNITTYAPAINNYCSQNNNITTDNCIKYYNNIEDMILLEYNLKN